WEGASKPAGVSGAGAPISREWQRAQGSGPAAASKAFLARCDLCENDTSNSIVRSAPTVRLDRSGFLPNGEFSVWHTRQKVVPRFRNSAAWQASFVHGLCAKPGNFRRPFGLVPSWQPPHSLTERPAFAWRLCSKTSTFAPDPAVKGGTSGAAP